MLVKMTHYGGQKFASQNSAIRETQKPKRPMDLIGHCTSTDLR